MRTELDRLGGPMKTLARAGVLATLVAMLPAGAWAQGGASPVRSQDEAIDVALNAIEGPVLQPLLVPPGTQRGLPPFPPYKQEPPAAQRDFRTLVTPAAAPPPNPGKGAPGGQPGNQPGGGATGSAGGGPAGPPAPPGGNPPSPPGQFPPPNIDPTPPNIGLPPPGPGLPPLPPGPFLRPARAR